MWKRLFRSKSPQKAEPTRLAETPRPVPAAAPITVTFAPAPSPEPSMPAAAPPASADATTLLETLAAQVAEGAAFSSALSAESPPDYLSPGMTCERAEDGQAQHLRLGAGKPRANPGGRPDAYTVRLPDAVELAASGRKIAVSVIARAAQEGRSKFAMCYSTNDVGNSGWIWCEAGADWTIFTFEYEVAPMKKGNGDFVGLNAGVNGATATDFACVSVRIL